VDNLMPGIGYFWKRWKRPRTSNRYYLSWQ